MWHFLIFLYFITILVSTTLCNQHYSFEYCEHYVKCAAFSKREERLCAGHNRYFPYWLPTVRPKEDPMYRLCHELLIPDYTQLFELEQQLQDQLLSCISERTMPLTTRQIYSCTTRMLIENRQFLNEARGDNYMPINCFQRTNDRVQRQCGHLLACCDAYSSCETQQRETLIAEQHAKKLLVIRTKAKDCELGLYGSDIRRAPSTHHEPTGELPNLSIRIRQGDDWSNRRVQQQPQSGTFDDHHRRLPSISTFRPDNNDADNGGTAARGRVVLPAAGDERIRVTVKSLDELGIADTPKPVNDDSPQVRLFHTPGLSVTIRNPSDDEQHRPRHSSRIVVLDKDDSGVLTFSRQPRRIDTKNEQEAAALHKFGDTKDVQLASLSKSRNEAPPPKFGETKIATAIDESHKLSDTQNVHGAGLHNLSDTKSVQAKPGPPAIVDSWGDEEAFLSRMIFEYDSGVPASNNIPTNKAIAISDPAAKVPERLTVTIRTENAEVPASSNIPTNKAIATSDPAAKVPERLTVTIRTENDTVAAAASPTTTRTNMAPPPPFLVTAAAPLPPAPRIFNTPVDIFKTPAKIQESPPRKIGVIETVDVVTSLPIRVYDAKPVPHIRTNMMTTKITVSDDIMEANRTEIIANATQQNITRACLLRRQITGKRVTVSNLKRARFEIADMLSLETLRTWLMAWYDAVTSRITELQHTNGTFAGLWTLGKNATDVDTFSEEADLITEALCDTLDGGMSEEFENMTHVAHRDAIENPFLNETGLEIVKEINESRVENVTVPIGNNLKPQENSSNDDNFLCDDYLRCRHQMTTAIDACNARRSVRVPFTRHAETLLEAAGAGGGAFGGDPCAGQIDDERNKLYNAVLQRNGRLRQCLRNETLEIAPSTKATCVALGETRFYSNEVVRRVVQMSYDSAHHCFNDANLLQQRCAQYRQCCPHFDICRQKSSDRRIEEEIMRKTADINEMERVCEKHKSQLHSIRLFGGKVQVPEAMALTRTTTTAYANPGTRPLQNVLNDSETDAIHRWYSFSTDDEKRERQ